MTTYPLPSDQPWHSLKEGLELAEDLDASVREEYRRLWQNAQAIPSEG